MKKDISISKPWNAITNTFGHKILPCKTTKYTILEICTTEELEICTTSFFFFKLQLETLDSCLRLWFQLTILFQNFEFLKFEIRNTFLGRD